MKIYRTATRKDYDALMIELESKGYKWLSGDKPTSKDYWSEDKENACIKISGEDITSASLDFYKEHYPNKSIIEYKAKGESMTKTNVDKELLKLLNETSKYTQKYLKTKKLAHLHEAINACNKLDNKLLDEEKILVFLFYKVGDYVVFDHSYGTSIAQIDTINENNKFIGLWYDKESNTFENDYKCPDKRWTRKATDAEIEEYKAALQFHEHGREPFEIKEGDLIEYPNGQNIMIYHPDCFSKTDFLNDGFKLIKTAEEVNEWLEK